MITFDQTLDSVVRIHELLKSQDKIGILIASTSANLSDFRTMLRYTHQKDFQTVDEALRYIDEVLLPQLKGIIDALESGTEEHLQRLGAARDHAERLMVSLEMVTDGGSGDLPA